MICRNFSKQQKFLNVIAYLFRFRTFWNIKKIVFVVLDKDSIKVSTLSEEFSIFRSLIGSLETFLIPFKAIGCKLDRSSGISAQKISFQNKD